jgi:hypothetical protein
MNTRIIEASVNGVSEYRVYYNQSIIGRFEKNVYAQQFANRLNGIGYILVNEDKDILCVFDSEPTIEEIKHQLEESYSMDLQVHAMLPMTLSNHYEVHGDNFSEIVEIVKTRLL